MIFDDFQTTIVVTRAGGAVFKDTHYFYSWTTKESDQNFCKKQETHYQSRHMIVQCSFCDNKFVPLKNCIAWPLGAIEKTGRYFKTRI